MTTSIDQKRKQRKAKVKKGQTISARRRAYQFRRRVVRYYNQLKGQVSEKRAAEMTLARYQPREEWHFPLSLSTIRRWARLVRQKGVTALQPQSSRPHTIHYQVPPHVVDTIYVLRKLFGWGGHRIAAELKRRGIGSVSGQGVYNILDRLGLPVKLYALRGRSDGIAYRRYEKTHPNAQWHIDLKHLTLTDGTKVYVCVIIDDYSRYALAAVAGRHKTTQWVTQVAQHTIARAGRPGQLVSDNGREFVSVWQDVLTTFGHLLMDQHITHQTTAPYYPQGNGKVEAFIKTLNREVLAGRSFDTLEDLQAALDRYLTFYNNYRAHSALQWQPPVTRYAGVAMPVTGLAGIPGIEPMAADPRYGPATCDPPIPISPSTAYPFTSPGPDRLTLFICL
jgi:transposase InsO family protein